MMLKMTHSGPTLSSPLYRTVVTRSLQIQRHWTQFLDIYSTVLVTSVQSP